MKHIGICTITPFWSMVVLSLNEEEVTSAWYDGESYSEISVEPLQFDEEGNGFFLKNNEVWKLNEFMTVREA